MGILLDRDVTRIAKKLKRILQDELGETTRLSRCQNAVAEAFDHDSFHALRRSLPKEAPWNGSWCANHLVDEECVEDPANAKEAVRRLETEIGHVIAGRPPFDVERRPPSDGAPGPTA